MNGIWKGKLTQAPGGCYPEYFIELQIKHVNQTITGFTYDYYDTSRYVKVLFTGVLDPVSKHLVITENKVVDFKVPKECIPCIKTYDLDFNDDNQLALSGKWKGVEMGSSRKCPPGNIYLMRVGHSAFEGAVASIPNPVPVALARPTVQRKIEVIKTLEFDATEISIELYDNGQIDGDTVSIFLNQRLIASRQRLTEKPLLITVPISRGQDYEMVMFADNLGSIPPNTALMVVKAGNSRYEVYLSSSEQKSAAVKFRMK